MENENLLKSINENYNLLIESDKITKLDGKTINDLFIIENGTKKYIVKIYNVDKENQINNSLSTQKFIFQSLKITADVLINKNNKLYTKFDNKFYVIQEFIEKQENSGKDIIKESANNLFFLHQELKKLDQDLYENKKVCSDRIAIIDNINKSKEKLEKANISKKVKSVYAELLKKRENLLVKYNCEYFPKNFQVIHRDVRSNNIIVSKSGVYFIDFDFVAYGDLLFEIGSSAMLISNFDIEKTKRFVKIYNDCLENKYSIEKIFKNLLAYYVQNDFPIKLVHKVDDKVLIRFIDDRIKCLDFCEKMLSY